MELFKRLIEKFRNQSRKKLIENAVIMIIIGVIIIIAGGSLFGKSDQGKKDARAGLQSGNSVETASRAVETESKSDVEKKLAAILSKIEGAGRVDVMITYASDGEIVPAYDTRQNENRTQERVKEGGTRSINQSDHEKKIVYEEVQGGGKKPIVIKELKPVARGVVVVAEGARDPVVKEKISRAVRVLMDISIHKVEVLERAR